MFEQQTVEQFAVYIDGVRSHVLGIDNGPAESVPVLKRISRDSVRRAATETSAAVRES